MHTQLEFEVGRGKQTAFGITAEHWIFLSQGFSYEKAKRYFLLLRYVLYRLADVCAFMRNWKEQKCTECIE